MFRSNNQSLHYGQSPQAEQRSFLPPSLRAGPAATNEARTLEGSTAHNIPCYDGLTPQPSKASQITRKPVPGAHGKQRNVDRGCRSNMQLLRNTLQDLAIDEDDDEDDDDFNPGFPTSRLDRGPYRPRTKELTTQCYGLGGQGMFNPCLRLKPLPIPTGIVHDIRREESFEEKLRAITRISRFDKQFRFWTWLRGVWEDVCYSFQQDDAPTSCSIVVSQVNYEDDAPPPYTPHGPVVHARASAAPFPDMRQYDIDRIEDGNRVLLPNWNAEAQTRTYHESEYECDTSTSSGPRSVHLEYGHIAFEERESALSSNGCSRARHSQREGDFLTLSQELRLADERDRQLVEDFTGYSEHAEFYSSPVPNIAYIDHPSGPQVEAEIRTCAIR